MVYRCGSSLLLTTIYRLDLRLQKVTPLAQNNRIQFYLFQLICGLPMTNGILC